MRRFQPVPAREKKQQKGGNQKETNKSNFQSTTQIRKEVRKAVKKFISF